jgi:metal-responsive CopG/Arc/MetJ family transcriptional regulator
MRDDYKLKGATARMEIELEKEVAEKIAKMESYSKLSRSEIANTALKRFISAHKDFLPPSADKGPPPRG